jgi:hypothetical protein
MRALLIAALPDEQEADGAMQARTVASRLPRPPRAPMAIGSHDQPEPSARGSEPLPLRRTDRLTCELPRQGHGVPFVGRTAELDRVLGSSPRTGRGARSPSWGRPASARRASRSRSATGSAPPPAGGGRRSDRPALALVSGPAPARIDPRPRAAGRSGQPRARADARPLAGLRAPRAGRAVRPAGPGRPPSSCGGAGARRTPPPPASSWPRPPAALRRSCRSSTSTSTTPRAARWSARSPSPRTGRAC